MAVCDASTRFVGSQAFHSQPTGFFLGPEQVWKNGDAFTYEIVALRGPLDAPIRSILILALFVITLEQLHTRKANLLGLSETMATKIACSQVK
jgi:hypothetical protein